MDQIRRERALAQNAAKSLRLVGLKPICLFNTFRHLVLSLKVRFYDDFSLVPSLGNSLMIIETNTL